MQMLFHGYAERLRRKYYHLHMGRALIAPGVHSRGFVVGRCEGIDSERGIAYRVADWLRQSRTRYTDAENNHHDIDPTSVILGSRSTAPP